MWPPNKYVESCKLPTEIFCYIYDATIQQYWIIRIVTLVFNVAEQKAIATFTD